MKVWHWIALGVAAIVLWKLYKDMQEANMPANQPGTLPGGLIPQTGYDWLNVNHKNFRFGLKL